MHRIDRKTPASQEESGFKIETAVLVSVKALYPDLRA